MGVFSEGRGVGEGTDNILGWVLLQLGVLLLSQSMQISIVLQMNCT